MFDEDVSAPVASVARGNLTKIQEIELLNEQELDIFHSIVDNLLWVTKIL